MKMSIAIESFEVQKMTMMTVIVVMIIVNMIVAINVIVIKLIICFLYLNIFIDNICFIGRIMARVLVLDYIIIKKHELRKYMHVL